MDITVVPSNHVDELHHFILSFCHLNGPLLSDSLFILEELDIFFDDELFERFIVFYCLVIDSLDILNGTQSELLLLSQTIGKVLLKFLEFQL